MQASRISMFLMVWGVALLQGIAHSQSPKPAPPAGALEADYRRLVETGQFSELVRCACTDLPSERGNLSMEVLGKVLATAEEPARRVLDMLPALGTGEADLLQAELLVRIACGDETSVRERKQRRDQPQVMATAEIGERAAALLGNPDPFVRSLAEWAISIRLNAECEGRKFSPWPDPEKTPWYRHWLAVDAGTLVECDHVRQAVGLGWHRSSQSLQASADVLAKHAEGLVQSLNRSAPSGTKKDLEKPMVQIYQARRALAQYIKAHPGDLPGQRQRWLAVRRAVRDVVLANPELGAGRLLFSTRTGPESGNITSGSLRDAFGPGGDLYIKSGPSPTDPAVPLLKGRLGPGHFRGLDLSWNADQVVFAYVKQPRYDPTRDAVEDNTECGRSEPSHLYTMQIDGSKLQQLTNLPYNSDVEPCYLPNGDLVFVSDRSNYGSQCSGMLQQDKTVTNLYRCGPDGKNVRWLSNNKEYDRYPHILANGQVLFLHWEYQERHLWQTHTLWTCRPDGSMTDALYKQHIPSGPMSLREARQVPGQSKLVTIACGHHNGEAGALFLVDYTVGVNNPEGMRSVTPHASGTEGGYGNVRPVAEGGVPDRGGHYAFPYPLSASSFLVAYSYKKPENNRACNFGLYYVDVWGNKELLHRDRFLSVAYLQLLRPRPRPPVLADQPQGKPPFATVLLKDADYGLRNSKDAPVPGVKYLRIGQKMPWPCVRDEKLPWGYNHLHATPSGAWTHVFGSWDWSPGRVIGEVPVEEDGSAWFKVPADQPVYFQALDANHLEIRRMRTNFTFQAGEVRGCVGCHESQARTPIVVSGGAVPLALRRAPSMPEAPAWGCRDLPSYERHIQPIFDRHCTACHGEKEPAGGLAFTGRRVGDYLQSYRTLFGLRPTQATPVVSEDAWKWWHPDEPAPPIDKNFYKLVEKNELPGQLVLLANRFSGAQVTPTLAFGSARSRLLRTLKEHPAHLKDVKIPREDWIALVTWVDLNAPYFDRFVDKEPTTRNLPARWVQVKFPDPWLGPPAGEWIWENETTVILKAK